MKGVFRDEPVKGVTPEVMSLPEQLSRDLEVLYTLQNLSIGYAVGGSSLWVVLRRANGGGLAVRTAHAHGGSIKANHEWTSADRVEITADTAEGLFTVAIHVPGEAEIAHIETRLRPHRDLIITNWPRDLYPLGARNAPEETTGEVHAAQRGLNAGVVFFSMPEPEFGTVLYLQDFTRLARYFEATGSKPDGVVGGVWPELGYQMPVAVDDKALPEGEDIVISSAFLHVNPELLTDETALGKSFIDLIAGVYPYLQRPETAFFDWRPLARRSLRDLKESPKATIRHYGNTYVHPYTDAEYPDSMVQLAVLWQIQQYAKWQGTEEPFAKELWRGFSRFYDPELKTVRRYLPNVGDDKDADQVDSWYLYHPLTNLARLAKEGWDDAKDLFFKSVDYSIKAARQFEYRWPVFFNIKTLEIIQEKREDGHPGQSDVGGLYAYVMQQAYDLSGDEKYLQEAGRALKALRGLRFYLLYQANLTNLGAVACLRQWRLTGDEEFRELSYLLLANGLHNTVLWESDIENAKNYNVFLGTTCLHNAPYMAIYECYESAMAYVEYLQVGEDEVSPAVRTMLAEFSRYGLNRARFFYPELLPKEALATEVRNSHIDRSLAFPLEDLYADGQPAGQVGQEVYGAGASFYFAHSAFHRIAEGSLTLYSEAPFVRISVTEDELEFKTGGSEDLKYRVRFMPLDRRKRKHLTLFGPRGVIVEVPETEKMSEHFLPGGTEYRLSWVKQHS